MAPLAHPTPFIINQRSFIATLEFTPVSVILCLLNLLVPFSQPHPHPLTFILVASPLYVNTHNIPLGLCLIAISLWPGAELPVRVTLIISALYIIAASSRK